MLLHSPKVQEMHLSRSNQHLRIIISCDQMTLILNKQENLYIVISIRIKIRMRPKVFTKSIYNNLKQIGLLPYSTLSHNVQRDLQFVEPPTQIKHPFPFHPSH